METPTEEYTPSPEVELLTSLQIHLSNRDVSDQFMLDECEDGECLVCGIIFCPSHEALHFHHDGCPCCDSEYFTETRIEAIP